MAHLFEARSWLRESPCWGDWDSSAGLSCKLPAPLYHLLEFVLCSACIYCIFILKDREPRWATEVSVIEGHFGPGEDSLLVHF